jgi:hypothetical protein
MPCFDARALETDPDGLALLREVLGPPKVCTSFGPEPHTGLTRDEGCSFSGLEARECAGVALHDPPPQAPEGLPSRDCPGDGIEREARPEIGRVVEGPTSLKAVGNGESQGGDCDPGPLEAALTGGGDAPPPPRGSPSPKSSHERHQRDPESPRRGSSATLARKAKQRPVPSSPGTRNGYPCLYGSQRIEVGGRHSGRKRGVPRRTG